MIGIGILFGLLTAVTQTAGYVVTRLFVLRSRLAVVDLLIASHIVMGAVACVLLGALRPELPPIGTWIGPLAGAAGFYVIAQIALLSLMRVANPSRVAPLLGIKIIVLAGISVMFFGVVLGPQQWVAVVLCGSAAFLLQTRGGHLTPGALVMLATAVTGYSLSDINIGRLVTTVAPGRPFTGSLVGLCVCYVALLLCALPGLLFLDRRGGVARTLRLSLPYSACWFGAMIFFFGSIALLQPVYAVILQSLRGIFSIIAGAWIAKLGHEHIEARIPRSLFWQRIAAAAMVIVAIWLYQAGR